MIPASAICCKPRGGRLARSYRNHRPGPSSQRVHRPVRPRPHSPHRWLWRPPPAPPWPDAVVLHAPGAALVDELLDLRSGEALLLFSYGPAYMEVRIAIAEGLRLGISVILITDTARSDLPPRSITLSSCHAASLAAWPCTAPLWSGSKLLLSSWPSSARHEPPKVCAGWKPSLEACCRHPDLS